VLLQELLILLALSHPLEPDIHRFCLCPGNIFQQKTSEENLDLLGNGGWTNIQPYYPQWWSKMLTNPMGIESFPNITNKKHTTGWWLNQHI